MSFRSGLLIWLPLLLSFCLAHNDQCGDIAGVQRLDCYPEAWATKDKCLARGCCWLEPDMLGHEVAPPTCFFPPTYPMYSVISKIENDRGLTLQLQKPDPENVYSEEFKQATLELRYETETRLRLRFTDYNTPRWEPEIPLDPPAKVIGKKQYEVKISEHPLGLEVIRGNQTLLGFSDYLTTALILSDQFLQVAFKINAHHGYGLGERRVPFPLTLHKWDRAGMWNRDMPPTEDVNLYGTQNFFIGVNEQGEAFGVYLLNSNAQEVAVQPLPALTYRTTGGILDFFVFTGPSPQDVVAQYIQLIGKPMLPPYWSLGFHLCRYGYKNLDQVKQVLKRNRDAGIPLDVQWLDIDYMDAEKDWTFDPVNFDGLGQFIKAELHDQYQMKNVIIVDPAINIIQGYKPYEDGLKMGIFVNDSRTGKPIVGQVWPGDTLFPDFSHPRIHDWWTKDAVEFHQTVSFDGLWIDMNEPSNFVDGSKMGCDPESLLDNPPYVPQVIGGTLYSKTLCPSALHYNSTHYNVHNLYGYTEAKVTHKTLDTIFPGKRQFLLTRSTFSGSGRYTYHWTGDNFSSWNDLLASVAQILNFNMFGIPMVGADICGFNGKTTEELCLRWSQLGAFYPFSRNHNSINVKAQDPAAFSKETVSAIRDAIRFRYFILPYMYSLFYRASLDGQMVARPLSFEFPSDVGTHRIDSQFMLGSCMLISPVTEEGLTSLYAYLPEGEWISASTSKRIKSQGATVVMDAPKEVIPVHFKAGCAIPLQKPDQTTAQARKNGLGLFVIIKKEDDGQAIFQGGVQASGELFWDDGETADQAYLHVKFLMTDRTLTTYPRIVPSKSGNQELSRNLNTSVDFVLIAGLKYNPNIVRINGLEADTTFDQKRSALKITPRQTTSWETALTIEYTF